MAEIHYDPLPYQEQFQSSKKAKVYLSAGYGAGKTYSLCMKGFELMDANAGLPGGIVAPTLKMFRRDILPTIREICDENDLDYSFNKQEYVFHFPDTKSELYVFHGEDDGKSIRGPNLAFMLINEVSLLSKATFDAAIARVRLKKAKRLQVAMSGTPEEFNWVYEYFVENPREDTDFIFGDMRLNTHNHESYAQTLIESYDARMVEQYVGGKFVNLTGNRAAYMFDRSKHCSDRIERIPEFPVWVSLDFNLNPMAASLWNRMPIDSPVRLRAFDEICLQSSDTFEMGHVLREKLGIEPGHEVPENVFLYPDPAGNAGSTKSRGRSDIDILRDLGFKNIKFKPSIPSVRDCLNATNNLLDKGQIEINHKECRNLVADLEQCKLKNGTSEIDKTNPKRTHWLDGMKNMIDFEFPVRKSQAGAREVTIR